MKRIVWIGGVACVAQIACIEDRTPASEGEPDSAVAPDVGPSPDARTPPAVDARPPEPEAPEPAPPEPAPPEPEAPEPAPPEPDPDPEGVPRTGCPPDNRSAFNVGACVGVVGLDSRSVGPIAAQITATGEGVPEGPCADGPALFVGRIDSPQARWFNATSPDGSVWQVVIDLPTAVRFVVGEDVVIEASTEDVFFDQGGHVTLSNSDGLQAYVQVNEASGPQLDTPELRLGRGEVTCYSEDGVCTFTGAGLSAADPRIDEAFELAFGEVRSVGPFEVINGGILSLGDLGACNAAPEDFDVGAWRRR